jgi:hypothetical protein
LYQPKVNFLILLLGSQFKTSLPQGEGSVNLKRRIAFGSLMTPISLNLDGTRDGQGKSSVKTKLDYVGSSRPH